MQVLEKRTYDSRIFDIDCSLLLPGDATISDVDEVVGDQGELEFGNGVVNDDAVTYTDDEGNEREVAAGKVIQVRISDGAIPPGVDELVCTLRARFTDSLTNELEATVLLRLTDEAPR